MEIAALKRRLAELEALQQQNAAPTPDVDQTLEAGVNASVSSSPQRIAVTA